MTFGDTGQDYLALTRSKSTYVPYIELQPNLQNGAINKHRMITTSQIKLPPNASIEPGDRNLAAPLYEQQFIARL